MIILRVLPSSVRRVAGWSSFYVKAQNGKELLCGREPAKAPPSGAYEISIGFFKDTESITGDDVLFAFVLPNGLSKEDLGFSEEQFCYAYNKPGHDGFIFYPL